jgi:hypothetical protein
LVRRSIRNRLGHLSLERLNRLGQRLWPFASRVNVSKGRRPVYAKFSRTRLESIPNALSIRYTHRRLAADPGP